MNLKPLNDQLIVEPVKEEKMTKGGIVIPETVDRERPVQGKVIAAGPGKTNEKGERNSMTVKVGDRVIFKKYAPDEIKIDGKEYYFIREDDVLAIVES